MTHKEHDSLDEEIERILQTAALASSVSVVFNTMNIDYVSFYEGILKLEEKSGPLEIFQIPDYFPSDKRKEILLYRLKEVISIKKILSSVWNLLLISEAPNPKIQTVMQSLQPEFKKQAESYLSYFELIFANIVEPLVEQAQENEPIRGYDRKINFVRDLVTELGRKNQVEYKIVSLLQGMNGMLRNALVHNNYYIKEETLHYFQTNPWKKEVGFKEMSLTEFSRLSGFTYFQRLIFNIICGLRFSNLSLEDVKKLSAKQFIKMSPREGKLGE